MPDAKSGTPPREAKLRCGTMLLPGQAFHVLRSGVVTIHACESLRWDRRGLSPEVSVVTPTEVFAPHECYADRGNALLQARHDAANFAQIHEAEARALRQTVLQLDMELRHEHSPAVAS